MNAPSHILLVDDEPRFAESLQQILLANNYSSTIAQDGSKAIELIQNNFFDLVLLDIDLPDMSGIQIISHIRKYLADTPIIMMTGNASVDTAVEAMKKGAYDYLKKPIVHDLLTVTIHKAINHFRLKKEFKASEQRFKTLSDASWEGILIHDKGIIIEANKQFFEIFGHQKHDLTGISILEIIFTKDSYKKIQRRIHEGLIGSHEATGIKKDGSEFPLETRSNYIEYNGQQARVCAVRDLTEQKKSEQEKLKLQMKLAKASKMEALGLMAGSVAHDLNNILAGIVSFPEVMLMEMAPTNKHREAIKGIQDAGKRAASVVSDLITIARGTMTPKTVKNPNSIITEHLSSIEHQDYISRYPGVSITTYLDASLLNMQCSEMHIKKILMNLLGNAMEALVNGGSIDISTENIHLPEPVTAYEKIAAGEYVKIAVSDNGSGIPLKDIEHIFEPFYSKKVMGKSGTGLGLAIVWNRIHDHDGFVNVKSGPAGTTFELYIPSTTDQEAFDNPAISLNSLRGNEEVILVVDDQKSQCLIACNLLKNIGYRTIHVTNGKEALDVCRKSPVDIVLLDMVLENGMNGRETYEQMLRINPTQKAIVVSGFPGNDELGKIQALGISHFVSKPYTIEQLAIAVKQSLRNIPGNYQHTQ